MTRLDEIQQRLAAATPAPWRLANPGEFPWRLGRVGADGEATVTILGGGGYGILSIPMSISDRKTANYDLIVHAPDDLRHLLRLARAGQACAEALEHSERLTRFCNHHPYPCNHQPDDECEVCATKREIQAALTRWQEAQG